METVNCISNQKLTEIEKEVYNLCVANAETYGEDGGFWKEVTIPKTKLLILLIKVKMQCFGLMRMQNC